MFRYILYNGDIYEGGCNMGDRHGKGEHEFYEDRKRGVGQWIRGRAEGEHKIYDKKGKMTVKHYKNGKRVEK